MRRLVAIIAGDPESINSEILVKAWRDKRSFGGLDIFVIGNYDLIKKQLKTLKIKLKMNKIHNIDNQNLKKNLTIYDVPLKFNKPFNISKINKKNYIIKCLELGIKLTKLNRIIGFVNCPINKIDVFKKNIGVTEFLAKKSGVIGKEVMLIYNKRLSVSPITTHLNLRKVSVNINSKKIVNKIITINNFFVKIFKIKPKICVTGLNPHNDEMRNNSEEKKIILPAIKYLKRKGIKIQGPVPADTAFLNLNERSFDVMVGMYHDQVLAPFKALFAFKAINITLGLPFLRISPDHGTGRDIIGKNLADPSSLLEAIRFFKRIDV